MGGYCFVLRVDGVRLAWDFLDNGSSLVGGWLIGNRISRVYSK